VPGDSADAVVTRLDAYGEIDVGNGNGASVMFRRRRRGVPGAEVGLVNSEFDSRNNPRFGKRKPELTLGHAKPIGGAWVVTIADIIADETQDVWHVCICQRRTVLFRSVRGCTVQATLNFLWYAREPNRNSGNHQRANRRSMFATKLRNYVAMTKSYTQRQTMFSRHSTALVVIKSGALTHFNTKSCIHVMYSRLYRAKNCSVRATSYRGP
jgi:hypothetical protein